MRASKGTRNKLTPMIGGLAAAAAVVGAVAPAVSPAVAAPSMGDQAVGASGLAQNGAYEACSAYFGFGKEEGAVGAVAFDVADTSGADGVAHAVPSDVGVVLVLENADDDVLECIPDEITKAQWDASYGGGPDSLPAWPGGGHFAYPTSFDYVFIGDDDDPDAFGRVTQAGFRVTGVPGSHTLVTPQGVQPLVDPFAPLDAMIRTGATDQRVVDLVAREVSPAAAAALRDAADLCFETEGGVDPVYDADGHLRAALDFIGDLVGFGPAPDDLGCEGLFYGTANASFHASVLASTSYVEPIRLAVDTTDPTVTTTTTVVPPAAAAAAAQARSADPTYTG